MSSYFSARRRHRIVTNAKVTGEGEGFEVSISELDYIGLAHDYEKIVQFCDEKCWNIIEQLDAMNVGNVADLVEIVNTGEQGNTPTHMLADAFSSISAAVMYTEKSEAEKSAFSVGFYLAQAVFLAQISYHGADEALGFLHKNRERQAQRGRKSAAVRRAEGEWGLEIAAELRQREPAISTAEIARRLHAADAPPAFQLPTYEARIRRWERESGLPKRKP